LLKLSPRSFIKRNRPLANIICSQRRNRASELASFLLKNIDSKNVDIQGGFRFFEKVNQKNSNNFTVKPIAELNLDSVPQALRYENLAYLFIAFVARNFFWFFAVFFFFQHRTHCIASRWVQAVIDILNNKQPPQIACGHNSFIHLTRIGETLKATRSYNDDGRRVEFLFKLEDFALKVREQAKGYVKAAQAYVDFRICVFGPHS
jgi:penicillin-binding protein-related factor A (putative recombinase)